MRAPGLSLLAAVVAISVSDALSTLNGRVDEEHNAIVVEAEDSTEGRESRQFWPIQPILRINEEDTINFGITPFRRAPVNARCALKEGGEGNCMSLKSCYPYFKIPNLAMSDTWVMGRFDTCSYDTPSGREAAGVCCNKSIPPGFKRPEDLPEEDLPEEDFVTDEFPVEFQVSENCGFRSVRPQVTLYNQPSATQRFFAAMPYIVHGYEAIQHEFPFMAALMNRNRQFCGGSLIDEKHVLTAAHCVAHMSKFDVQNLRVRLGDHNIRSTSDGQHVEKRVKRVIRHKGFSSTTLWNDVAILTLDEEVQMTDNIQNVCLASDKAEKFKGQYVTVAGWGTLSEGGSQPANLMKVDVKVWANDKCRRSYGSSAPGGITKHMLCASDKKRGQNLDSCSGDSGGPLFICLPGTCTQIGIVSWGIGCAKEQYPGVYTRVTEMMPWIRRIVKEY
jgi:V8-like Glu-specific endopeptidase